MALTNIVADTPASPTFGSLLYGSGLDQATKDSIQGLYRNASSSDPRTIQSLHQAIYGSGLDQATKDQLAGMMTYAPRTATQPRVSSGGSGGGGMSTSSGGSGGGSTTVSGSSSPTDDALAWAQAILKGDFSSNPLYSQVTDTAGYRQAVDDYLAQIQDQLKSDWLGNQAALADQAEAGGRYGSGLYQSQSYQNALAADKAYANAAAQANIAYEQDNRDRQAQIFNSLLGTQVNAAGLPIQKYGMDRQYDVGMAGVAAQNRAIGLQAQEFAFNKKMQLAQAQQNALNDYYNMLSGIGGWGGTQWGMQPGNSSIPTMPSGQAALLGGLGGALQGYGMSQMGGGGQSMNYQPTYGVGSQYAGFNYGAPVFHG